jgi:hypothetical protein
MKEKILRREYYEVINSRWTYNYNGRVLAYNTAHKIFDQEIRGTSVLLICFSKNARWVKF